MKWIIGLLACFNVYAATDLEGGGMMLTAEEVQATRDRFAEMQFKVMEQGGRIRDLEQAVEFYRTSRCT